MTPSETWIVGPEHEEALFSRLKMALLDLGYRPANKWWGMGGSQEVSHWEFSGALGNLTVEAETYVGLTITGTEAAVAQVRDRMDLLTEQK